MKNQTTYVVKRDGYSDHEMVIARINDRAFVPVSSEDLKMLGFSDSDYFKVMAGDRVVCTTSEIDALDGMIAQYS